mgnify:CR=1 FL=1
MIYLIDNFLDDKLFKSTADHLNNNNYNEYKTPGKSFWVQEAEPEFISNVLEILSKKEGRELESVLGFFRVSTDVIDSEWRIHSDGIINNEQPDNWRLNTVLGYEQNRLISYPANYFHSKYPNKSWKKGRQVFVMFYKIK